MKNLSKKNIPIPLLKWAIAGEDVGISNVMQGIDLKGLLR
jgi:hypothetical protein